MSEWISVDDKLPMHTMVLGYDGDYQFCMMIASRLQVHYDDGGWSEPRSPVTHWMELPKPPE